MASSDTVTLTLATALAAGDQVTISGKGTNPAATSTDEVSVGPETGSAGSLKAAGAVESSTNALVFGTFVSDVTVAASPSVASRHRDLRSQLPGDEPAVRDGRGSDLSERGRRANQLLQSKGGLGLRHDRWVALHG